MSERNARTVLGDQARVAAATSCGSSSCRLGARCATGRLGERLTTMIASTALFATGLLALALLRSPLANAGTYLVAPTAWPAVTLSYVMSWPDIFHIRVLPAVCATVNCMSQLGGFLMPIAWGAAKDATGGSLAGLFGLAAACIAAMLVAHLIRRQVLNRAPYGSRSTGLRSLSNVGSLQRQA